MTPPASYDDNTNGDNDRKALIMKAETLSPLGRDDKCKIKKTSRESDDGDENPRKRPKVTEEKQEQKQISGTNQELSTPSISTDKSQRPRRRKRWKKVARPRVPPIPSASESLSSGSINCSPMRVHTMAINEVAKNNTTIATTSRVVCQHLPSQQNDLTVSSPAISCPWPSAPTASTAPNIRDLQRQDLHNSARILTNMRASGQDSIRLPSHAVSMYLGNQSEQNSPHD